MKISRRSSILILVSLWFGPLMYSQGDFWIPLNGPYGGPVYALVHDSGGRIFAGTDMGVFRSSDSGNSWTRMSTGLSNQLIRSLVVDTNGYIFAGTFGGGVCKSSDGGNSWLSVGLSANYVYALAVNSRNELLAGTGAGVYRSTDGGGSWLQINNGLTYSIVRSIAVDSIAYLYVGTFGGGIYRSTNNGETWVQSNAGLVTSNVSSMAVHPNGQIFAGTDGGGVYRSTDSGQHWIQLNNGLASPYIYAVTFNSQGYVFVGSGSGVLRSSDLGDSWNQAGLGDLIVRGVDIQLNDDILSATASAGIFRSNDNGSTWQASNAGLNNTNIRAFEISPLGVLFTGTDGGVQRSTDGGFSWTTIGLAGHVVSSLRSVSGNTLIAGTQSNGLYKSTNNGSSWTFSGLTAQAIRAIVSSSPNNIFAGTYGNGVYRSTDSGNTWSPCGSLNNYIYALEINPPGYLFAGTFGGGVFRSTNNGETWVQTNTGIANTTIRSICAKSNGSLFAGTAGGGVYRSTDHGDTWTFTGMNTRHVYKIIFNSSGEGFAGTDGGAYNSTDDGLSWNQINSGLPDASIISMHIDSRGYVYAGTAGAAVYRSAEPTHVLPTIAIGVRKGWNMISVPVDVTDSRLKSVFPHAITKAYTYVGDRYVTSDTLAGGVGYWVKFPAEETVMVAGISRLFDTVNVSAGWNMIGTVSFAVPTNTIASDPPGIMTSEFYGYTGRYFTSNTLIPGAGYWVKTMQTGSIILLSSQPTALEMWTKTPTTGCPYSRFNQNKKTANTKSDFSSMSPDGLITRVHVVELPPDPPFDQSENALSRTNVPIDFSLDQCYPNPFNPATTISYQLPEASYVRLSVYNLLGEIVNIPVDDYQDAGYKQVRFDASHLPSGVYTYCLQASRFSAVRRMIVLK